MKHSYRIIFATLMMCITCSVGASVSNKRQFLFFDVGSNYNNFEYAYGEDFFRDSSTNLGIFYGINNAKLLSVNFNYEIGIDFPVSSGKKVKHMGQGDSFPGTPNYKLNYGEHAYWNTKTKLVSVMFLLTETVGVSSGSAINLYAAVGLSASKITATAYLFRDEYGEVPDKYKNASAVKFTKIGAIPIIRLGIAFLDDRRISARIYAQWRFDSCFGSVRNVTRKNSTCSIRPDTSVGLYAGLRFRV